MFANSLRRTFVANNRTLYLSNVRFKAAYEGEGKTVVRVLNQEPDASLMIDAYSTCGFRLNNGISVLGPLAIFPKSVFSWQISGSHEITEQSLKFFKVLDPKIDLLIIGLETDNRNTVTQVFKAAKANNLNIEVLKTEHACSTFNFLNSEGRCVAAAMIPPTVVSLNEDDMLETKLHYLNLYNKK